MKKRTQMICTVGPASADPALLEKMMRSGMDVARLNFSHAQHNDHKRLIRSIRTASKNAKKHIPILGDLQGPKIRLGVLPEAGVELRNGGKVVLVPETKTLVPGTLPITYKHLARDVKKGHRILIEDGLYELSVVRVVGAHVHAKVMNGGIVTSHKGMNFPDSTLSVSTMTTKDKADVLFGIDQSVNWFALSFVTSPESVTSLKRLIKKHTPKGRELARVMVKIEKHEAVTRFDEILSVADAVMIARGDLGVEIEMDEVPVIQKKLIERCQQAGKPVVVATQMLDSMIRNPRPTRAEVSDVANAVFDCASAVMLSGETASGAYPLQAVRMMAKTIKTAEASCYDDQCEEEEGCRF